MPPTARRTGRARFPTRAEHESTTKSKKTAAGKGNEVGEEPGRAAEPVVHDGVFKSRAKEGIKCSDARARSSIRRVRRLNRLGTWASQGARENGHQGHIQLGARGRRERAMSSYRGRSSFRPDGPHLGPVSVIDHLAQPLRAREPLRTSPTVLQETEHA